jgi:arginine:pyruvate transaminase
MRFAPLVSAISGRGAGAWAVHSEAMRQRAAGRDITFLSVGDPDQRAPQCVIEATVAALRDGETGYSGIIGLPQVRAAIAARIARRTGQACAAENIAVLPGAQAALFAALQCLAGSGDEVITPEPMYATYEAVGRSTGARIVNVALRPESGFRIDVAEVERAVTPSTRMVWINSPHNPTGVVMTHAEVAAIARICARHDLWLLSDEVYEDIAYTSPHVSAWSLAEATGRVVVASSLSKSHAMPGFRMGWLAGPPELTAHLHNLILAMFYGSPRFVQLGALPALTAELPEVASLRQDYARRAALVHAILATAPNCRSNPPQGGMFALLDVRGTGLSAEAFARLLLERKAIAVVPCDGFGPSGYGQLRISLTLSDASLAAAAHRIVDLAREVSQAPVEA